MKKYFLLACLMGATGLFAQNIDKSKFNSPTNAKEMIAEKQSTSPAKL